MDTTIATITVQRITPIKNAGKLLALADVETVIDGVALVIHGVQVRADGDKTEIALPRYRAPNGEWQTAITLPEEVREPMANVVIAGAIEIGLLKQR
ncbi:MAG: hypothetical protein HY055_14385 [Magnetospirillum sp.]|jgi:stage V sporulation protein G|uniref:Uncharacterized protein n=1 Tax=Paramagnetospirillum magnetotacticum MS-1 TaxID=272627 RepID=A0A0C2YQC7_PARME|nr:MULTISPECIES: Uncharacterized protein, involved in the regulation of septum location [Paramagnetospirillum]KIL96880.1 hypothetical protein CCC_01373 [Paramagnetospirillum magnetotacticum MS-1]KIL98237.1 hypothetical protein CCC_01298 [Paramagnetospirillum magnetotacticum MS-1]MBI3446502.1 hypothetical protein [Magnetospirillum sp.]MDO8608146.1 hypothetical protein [Phaeospirillum sp.]